MQTDAGIFTPPTLTDHARKRAQSRGVSMQIVEAIYAYADRSPFVGSGCRSLMVSRRELDRLADSIPAADRERAPAYALPLQRRHLRLGTTAAPSDNNKIMARNVSGATGASATVAGAIGKVVRHVVADTYVRTGTRNLGMPTLESQYLQELYDGTQMRFCQT